MIEVYIDGASAGSPGISGAGIWIKNGKTPLYFSIPLPVMTNQEAEFEACLYALKICVENGYKVVSFRTDSNFVAGALERQYVKSDQFKPYLQKAIDYLQEFDLFFIKWIPESQNKKADELARLAVHKQMKKHRL